MPTDCGSHTHTLVPDAENNRALLYVASYTATELPVLQYGNECKRMNADGTHAHQKISVVEVPLANPAAVGRRLRADVPAERPQPITPPATTAATTSRCTWRSSAPSSACMGEGQIWDISDKENPKTIARIHNPNVEFFHSAAFSWDGRTVVFGDEAGGGTGPRCRPQDADTLGALWFYDVEEPRQHGQRVPWSRG